MVTTKKMNNGINVQFNFAFGEEGFNIALDNVKSLPGRKWDAASKRWTVPNIPLVIEKMKSWNWIIDPLLEKIVHKEVKIDFPEGLNLYPFQKAGVEFIESREGRALIGDEMGLGKTVQALSYCIIHLELRPIIIVCPASLKINWKNECVKWGVKEIPYLISGRNYDNKSKYQNEKILIINYDILKDHVNTLIDMNPQILICDESHMIRNKKTNRAKAVVALSKHCNKIIALSGTPIINKPVEFYNILNVLRPKVFNNFWNYAQKFCGGKHNGFGWDFSGASNTEELNIILKQTVMIRRTKAEVLPELPPKRKVIIPLEIDNRKEYEKTIDDFDDSENVLASIEALKQVAVNGKLKQAIKWIENFLDSDEKLVVFATHHFTIDSIMKAFPDISVKLDGRDSQDKRQFSVDEFQNNSDVRLFVGNIKAAGVGITLTAASNTCFLELGWTPGEMEQAEDRVHRIGQEDSVTSYYLIADNTIENDIIELLDKKKIILDAVIDGKKTKDESLLKAILQKIKGEKK